MRTIPQQRDREHRFAVADQAQSLCEQAIRERPRDPAPHIVLALQTLLMLSTLPTLTPAIRTGESLRMFAAFLKTAWR